VIQTNSGKSYINDIGPVKTDWCAFTSTKKKVENWIMTTLMVWFKGFFPELFLPCPLIPQSVEVHNYTIGRKLLFFIAPGLIKYSVQAFEGKTLIFNLTTYSKYIEE